MSHSWVVDESHLFNSAVTTNWLSNYLTPVEVEITKLKITLSRELTYAEREALREKFTEEAWTESWRFEGGSILFVSSVYDSRWLAWEIHDYLGREFFNVYIRAVHTRSPKVNV